MKKISDLIEEGVISSGNLQVIDMKQGEYLMDILASITDASVDKQYTINFYNHSKTIDWTRWTGLIQWPRFVHLNFVGDIDWWPVNFNPMMRFDEGLIAENPIDKLFLGFTFDRSNGDSWLFKSGLPSDLKFIYFGGLDNVNSIAPDYDTLIGDIEFYGQGLLNLVSVEGNKDVDARNRELYKIIDGVPVKITTSFAFCLLSGMNLQGAYLYQANLQWANLQGAYLTQADLQGANLTQANLQEANLQWANLFQANLQRANLTQANLQEATLQWANLFQANLQEANLQWANLWGADLWGANLQWANLQGANLTQANLQEANLQRAYLQDIQVNNQTNFKGANLTGATNLPADMDTKAEFIAKVGAGNVNANTVWVNGTSILA